MTPARLTAILVLAVALAAGGWAFATLRAGTATMKQQAPKYPVVSAEQMVAELSKEQIADRAAAAIEKHREMEALWRAGRTTDYGVFFVLVVVMGSLALTLAVLLWRRGPAR